MATRRISVRLDIPALKPIESSLEGEIKIVSKKVKDAPGMKGVRSRTNKGPLRQKRGDTRVSTIEKQYGRDFGVRGDMHLSTLLKRRGVESLNDLLHGKK